MRKFILGTDWWTDCDDAMAVRLLANAVLSKKAELLGVGINACMEYSTASLNRFLNDSGITGVPIGIDREATDFGGKPRYQERLALRSGNKPDNSSAEDAVQMYIRLLGESPEKVEILEIGYPQVLAGVMKAEPKLFAEKVSKIWMMAGKWDENPGKENNFARNARSAEAGNYICENAAVPITFLGFEVGATVIAGGRTNPSDSLYSVLADHGSANGRCAWDPMLILLAMIGDEEKAGYTVTRGTAFVDGKTGENSFEKSEKGNHLFVTKTKPDSCYAEEINRRLPLNAEF